MKHFNSPLFLFFFLILSNQFYAQNNCQKICEVDREIGEGVFLGVQISQLKSRSTPKIIKIVEGTAAEKMGLQTGDFVQSINHVKMEGVKFMANWVGDQYFGAPVEILVQRKGESMKIKGNLGYKSVETVKEEICCDELNELNISNVSMFPNPSRGAFSLSFEGVTEEKYNLRIATMTGQIIFDNEIYPSGKSVNEQIQINVPATGDYLVLIQQGEKSYRKKMVFLK